MAQREPFTSTDPIQGVVARAERLAGPQTVFGLPKIVETVFQMMWQSSRHERLDVFDVVLDPSWKSFAAACVICQRPDAGPDAEAGLALAGQNWFSWCGLGRGRP